MSDIGPIQALVVGFEQARLEGRVVQELERLEAAGTVRVLDLLFVTRDEENGDLVAVAVPGSELGAVAGALLGFESDGNGDDGGIPVAPLDEHTYGISTDDLESVVRTITPGAAVGLLLIEHVWARGLKTAIRDAGGVPIAEGFLTPETLAAVAEDLAAMSDAIEKEQAAGVA
jgi:uncharacterized membrane protein